MLEEVLGKFWNAENLEGRDDEWRKDDAGGFEGSEKDWVYLCTPFVCCLSRPVGVFLGFKSLMERMSKSPSISTYTYMRHIQQLQELFPHYLYD